MNSKIISIGAFLGCLGVALGAFGAHALKTKLTPEMLAIWHTGVEYHFGHALALILIGLIAGQVKTKSVKFAAGSILGGIVVFSGSLYAYATTGTTAFAMITPIGGVLFMLGWLTLAVTLWHHAS